MRSNYYPSKRHQYVKPFGISIFIADIGAENSSHSPRSTLGWAGAFGNDGRLRCRESISGGGAGRSGIADGGKASCVAGADCGGAHEV